MSWGTKRLRKIYFVSAITAGVVVLDYITKRIIETYVHPHQVIDVLPFLRIVFVKNTGAAFGMFASVSNKIFIAISITAIVLIIIYMIKTPKKLEALALSLILGGAIGNLIDRVTIGKVIDFIDFFVNNWHWPAFNVADSALSIGIILFILVNLKQMKHHEKTKDET